MHAPRQAGVSLISLMVGLVISMLVVLTTMSVYRVGIRAATDASQGAQQSGQFSTGLLAAQMKLQGAGFGIVDAETSRDLVIVANATLNDSNVLSGTAQSSVPASGNAVIWRELANDGISGRCQALVFAQQALQLLTSAGSCSDASNALGSVTWDTPPIQLVSEAAGDHRGTFSATLIDEECNPFGVTQHSAGRMLVRLQASYLAAADTIDATRPTRTASVCLSNFAADIPT